VTVDLDLDPFLERELEPIGDERREIWLEVLQPSLLLELWGRGNQEVDSYLQIFELPRLPDGVAFFVLFWVKALPDQPLMQLGVALLIQDRNGEPDIEVVGSRVKAPSVATRVRQSDSTCRVSSRL
jgi:hypothetical protein